MTYVDNFLWFQTNYTVTMTSQLKLALYMSTKILTVNLISHRKLLLKKWYLISNLEDSYIPILNHYLSEKLNPLLSSTWLVKRGLGNQYPFMSLMNFWDT